MSQAQQIFGWLGVLQGFVLFAACSTAATPTDCRYSRMYVGGLRVFGAIYDLNATCDTWMLLQVVDPPSGSASLELTYGSSGRFPAPR